MFKELAYDKNDCKENRRQSYIENLEEHEGYCNYI